MREIDTNSASTSSSDSSKIGFGTHGRSLYHDANTTDGIYKVKAGDTLWSVARELLQESGHKASNKDIAHLVRETADKNHLRNANLIKSNMELRLSLPPLQVATATESAQAGANTVARKGDPAHTLAPVPASEARTETPPASRTAQRAGVSAGAPAESAPVSNADGTATGAAVRQAVAAAGRPLADAAVRPAAADGNHATTDERPVTPSDRPAVSTPASVERTVAPPASSDPYESSVPGRSEVNKAAAIVADNSLSAEQKYNQSLPHFIEGLRGASTINEQVVQNQLVSTQKQLDALTSDPTKNADASTRQNLEGQIALLKQLRAEPFNAQLSFATGLNSIAHQVTEQAKNDPANATLLIQNADHLNNAAVTMLQDIGKNDPGYGGASASDTVLYKRVVDDGIANAQRGNLIDIQKSSNAFNQELTRSFVASKIAQDGTYLHSLTIGPTPALSAGIVSYNLMQDAIKAIPVVGGTMSFQIPLLPSASSVQNQLTGEFKAAKAADPIAAHQAIQSHTQDLKSQTVNGISTFLAGFGGMAAAEATLAGAAKLGLEIPNPIVKVVSVVALALVEGLAMNEATQATAHATIGTTMDSQNKLLSETTASVASWALLKKLPLSIGAKTDALKFTGVLSTGVKATAIRAGVGFVPGAAYALANYGPWNTNSATNQHYTVGDTLKATAIAGGITAGAIALAPLAAEFATNAGRTLWRYKNVVGASAVTNAVYEAGSVNPTQVNPKTGKRYTLAETAIGGAENLGTGAVGGLIVGKALPMAAKFTAWLPNTTLNVIKWSTNETAGTVTAAAAAEAQVATRATLVGKAKAVVKPVENGVNQARRFLGQQKVNLVQKVAGENTYVGRTVTPQVTRAHKVITDVAPKAAALATPATGAFLAPGAELYRWNKADQASDK